ncbi:Pyruvate kinase [compost metagenome]
MAWGIYSLLNPRLDKVEELTGTALAAARSQGMAKSGDTVVITAGFPIGQQGSTNMLRIEQIG